MPPETIDEQLVKHLTDVHSIEEQALQQMRVAPRLARDPELAQAFREHIGETEEHERRVRARLEARGADPSKVKDLVARAGGVGMVLFARSQPDTPGKLTAHAFSYEHMELAAYDLLALVAERAGDPETVDMARSIEAQAVQLLSLGPSIAGQFELAGVLSMHLEETRAQQEAVRERLRQRGGRPSRFKDIALRGGGVNVGGFFGAQPDTPAKLAGFAFAFEHLEIASYELLKRVAQRAGDEETVALAERILGEERAAAEAVREQFEPTVEASLEAQD